MTMIAIKYDAEVSKESVLKHIDRLTNQIFKLLPNREEGGEWQAPLNNLIIEVVGMNRLLGDHSMLFSLLCKMEALSTLTEEEDFLQFRRTIFECLSLMGEFKKCLD